MHLLVATAACVGDGCGSLLCKPTISLALSSLLAVGDRDSIDSSRKVDTTNATQVKGFNINRSHGKMAVCTALPIPF